MQLSLSSNDSPSALASVSVSSGSSNLSVSPPSLSNSVPHSPTIPHSRSPHFSNTVVGSSFGSAALPTSTPPSTNTNSSKSSSSSSSSTSLSNGAPRPLTITTRPASAAAIAMSAGQSSNRTHSPSMAPLNLSAKAAGNILMSRPMSPSVATFAGQVSAVARQQQQAAHQKEFLQQHHQIHSQHSQQSSSPLPITPTSLPSSPLSVVQPSPAAPPQLISSPSSVLRPPIVKTSDSVNSTNSSALSSLPASLASSSSATVSPPPSPTPGSSTPPPLPPALTLTLKMPLSTTAPVYIPPSPKNMERERERERGDRDRDRDSSADTTVAIAAAVALSASGRAIPPGRHARPSSPFTIAAALQNTSAPGRHTAQTPPQSTPPTSTSATPNSLSAAGNSMKKPPPLPPTPLFTSPTSASAPASASTSPASTSPASTSPTGSNGGTPVGTLTSAVSPLVAPPPLQPMPNAAFVSATPSPPTPPPPLIANMRLNVPGPTAAGVTGGTVIGSVSGSPKNASPASQNRALSVVPVKPPPLPAAAAQAMAVLAAQQQQQQLLVPSTQATAGGSGSYPLPVMRKQHHTSTPLTNLPIPPPVPVSVASGSGGGALPTPASASGGYPPAAFARAGSHGNSIISTLTPSPSPPPLPSRASSVNSVASVASLASLASVSSLSTLPQSVNSSAHGKSLSISSNTGSVSGIPLSLSLSMLDRTLPTSASGSLSSAGGGSGVYPIFERQRGMSAAQRKEKDLKSMEEMKSVLKELMGQQMRSSRRMKGAEMGGVSVFQPIMEKGRTMSKEKPQSPATQSMYLSSQSPYAPSTSSSSSPPSSYPNSSLLASSTSSSPPQTSAALGPQPNASGYVSMSMGANSSFARSGKDRLFSRLRGQKKNNHGTIANQIDSRSASATVSHQKHLSLSSIGSGALSSTNSGGVSPASPGNSPPPSPPQTSSYLSMDDSFIPVAPPPPSAAAAAAWNTSSPLSNSPISSPNTSVRSPFQMSRKAREMMHGKSLREQRPLDLLGMLKTNVGYRFMLVHLYREYSEENLLAFKAIEKFKKHPSIHVLKAVNEKYLTTTAPLQINISHEVREGVAAMIEKLESGELTADIRSSVITAWDEDREGKANDKDEPEANNPASASIITISTEPSQALSVSSNNSASSTASSSPSPSTSTASSSASSASTNVDLSSVLDSVLKEILSLLNRDSFKRFKKSKLYMDYVSGREPPTNLKRGGEDEAGADDESKQLSPNIPFPRAIPEENEERALTFSKESQKDVDRDKEKEKERERDKEREKGKEKEGKEKQRRPAEMLSLLRTSVGFRFFLAYLYRIRHEESILAFKAIEIFRKFTSAPALLRFQKKYLLPTSLFSVVQLLAPQLQAEAQQVVRSCKDGFEPSSLSASLDPIQKELELHLGREHFPLFLKSDEFNEYFNWMKPPPEVFQRGAADSDSAPTSAADEDNQNKLDRMKLKEIHEVIAATMLLPEYGEDDDEEDEHSYSQRGKKTIAPLQHAGSPNSSSASQSFTAASTSSSAASALPVLSSTPTPPSESSRSYKTNKVGRLKICVWYTPSNNLLHVTLLEAADLPPNSEGETPTRFVKLYVLPDPNKKSKKKSSKKKELNPQFYEHYTFRVNADEVGIASAVVSDELRLQQSISSTSLHRRLEISVWNYYYGHANEYVGQCVIPLQMMPISSEDSNATRWLDVENVRWVSRKTKELHQQGGL